MTAPGTDVARRFRVDERIFGGLLLLIAAGCWWLSARMAGSGAMMAGSDTMGVSLAIGGFLAAWVAMMAAMMLPAVLPVVRLYARAAARGRVAPLPFFLLGYLLVWSAAGVPAYVSWRVLSAPTMDGAPWAARLAGTVLLVAAAYQVSPLKSVCLRHCRSPLGFFLALRGNLRRPVPAVRAGLAHGAICFGCCWALMAVLVALGVMQLAWMVGLAALIFVEKNLRAGPRIAVAAAVLLGAAGIALLASPHMLAYLT